MAKIVIVGAGFAGQYAALVLYNALKDRGNNEITVINRHPNFFYIPSMIWVGIGQMKAEKTQFSLEKVYKKLGIKLIVGKVSTIAPEQKILIIDEGESLEYDYLLISTGPYLNFDATPGLGPDKGYTRSICTAPHAQEAGEKYLELVKRLEKGEKAEIVIGTGHGTSTCHGAAFEYICNIHNDLVKRKLRNKVKLTYLSNEPRLGDFGIDGLEAKRGSLIYTSELMTEGVFHDYDIKYVTNSHVHKVDGGKIYTENVEGVFSEINYDFAMLIPQFKGQPIKWIDKENKDISDKICTSHGFIKVDADYSETGKNYDGSKWPKNYQNPVYKNIFAAGIAFAPPGPLSQGGCSPNGTIIVPGPPRTGFSAEISGKTAALNIANMLQGQEPAVTGSMGDTPGICIASMNNSIFSGSAGTMAIYPMIRNRLKYQEGGRDIDLCKAEIGMAGAWFKIALHYAFMYKLQAKPFWKAIP